MLFLINIIISPDNLWFFWATIFWGLGLAIHGLSTFIFDGWFANMKSGLVNSELRKIKK